MLKCTIYRNKRGQIFRYVVSGHSRDGMNWKDKRRNIIICNSLSVITQMPIVGLKNCLHINVDWEAEAREGKLVVELPKTNKDTELLLSEMIEAVKELSNVYKGRIIVEEVKDEKV